MTKPLPPSPRPAIHKIISTMETEDYLSMKTEDSLKCGNIKYGNKILEKEEYLRNGNRRLLKV